MTVTVSKPQLNLREELSALKKKSGVKGEELLRANTVADAYASLNCVMFRNRIINGNMVIAQRATSYNNSGTSYAVTYTTVDRFQSYRSAGVSNLNVTQYTSGGPTGLPYYVRIQRASGDTSTNALWISQSIESKNCIDLIGQQISFSFWVRTGANFSGTSILPQIYYGTSGESNLYNGFSGQGGMTLSISSIQVSTTWQYVTAYGTVPSNAVQLGVQIGYNPSGTAGANDYFEVTGIQLEKGSVATPFEFRPYGTELTLCQRYYQRLTANASADIVFPASLNPGTTNNLVSYFPCVTMRASPTTSANTTTWGYCRNGGSFTTYATNAVPSVGSGATSAFVPFYANVASGLTSAGLGVTYISTNNWVDFSAEL